MKRIHQTGLLVLSCTTLMSCGPTQEPYTPKIICHNSNCVEPTNPSEDDTPEALKASLELMTSDDRPYIDGVELDTFWYGEQGTCLFAHDLKHVEESLPAIDGIKIVTDHLRKRAEQNKPITRTAPFFTILLEMKDTVGTSSSDVHTPEQRKQHAQCILSMIEHLEEEARTHGHELKVVTMSFVPELLSAIHAEEKFKSMRAASTLRLSLGIIQGISKPLHGGSRTLDLFPEELGIDFITAHPHWTRHTLLQAAGAKGLSLSLWMFSIVPETLQAIEAYEPEYITTSEATTMVRWLER